MAPVSLPDDLQAKLTLLVTQDTPVVKDFCRLASQYFRQEVKQRVFGSAAAKLGAQPAQVMWGVFVVWIELCVFLLC